MGRNHCPRRKPLRQAVQVEEVLRVRLEGKIGTEPLTPKALCFGLVWDFSKPFVGKMVTMAPNSRLMRLPLGLKWLTFASVGLGQAERLTIFTLNRLYTLIFVHDC